MYVCICIYMYTANVATESGHAHAQSTKIVHTHLKSVFKKVLVTWQALDSLLFRNGPFMYTYAHIYTYILEIFVCSATPRTWHTCVYVCIYLISSDISHSRLSHTHPRDISEEMHTEMCMGKSVTCHKRLYVYVYIRRGESLMTCYVPLFPIHIYVIFKRRCTLKCVWERA